jgi:hypothetical protein
MCKSGYHFSDIQGRRACSLGLSATCQQYFSLRTNQPPTISQQYFSLRTNQHQPSATSQTNRLFASLSLYIHTLVDLERFVGLIQIIRIFLKGKLWGRSPTVFKNFSLKE